MAVVIYTPDPAADRGGSCQARREIALVAYADQNDCDYAALQAAVKDGRADATTEI